MHLQPVIQRELTVASRRIQTWRLRVAFGIGAVGALGFGMLLPDIRPGERGQVVLLCLAVCGFILSVFSGAYLTADTVSSEKREGTLGLLFLTPLRGWEIVLGKMLTHSVQVGYALVGVFPVFFVPLLLGGVLWNEVARITLVLLLTLLLSLACGMFWSTVTTEARTAVLATAVTMLLVTLLPLALPFLEGLVFRRSPNLTGIPQASPMTALIFAFESNFRTRAVAVTGIAPGRWVFWGCIGCSFAISLGVQVLSGWLLPRVWRRSEAGARQKETPASAESLAARDGADGTKARARVRSRRPSWAPSLEQAPLLWLASRDLSEPVWLRFFRAATLIFFGYMLVISVSTRHWREGYMAAFFAAYGWHLLTRMQLLLASTRRLHEERRNGTLEALLATPVTDRELIAAHHAALKHAFRAPLLVLLGLNAALQLAVLLFPKKLNMGGGAGEFFTVFWLGGIAITLADFWALRWLGLREALRSATQMKAVGRVFGWLFCAAWLAFGVAVLIAVQFRDEGQAAVVFAFWFATCLLYNNALVRRCQQWLAPGLRYRVAEGPVA